MGEAAAAVSEVETNAGEDRSVAGRVFAIIDCVSSAGDEITLAELVRRTGIPKPSVSRIANQLVTRRILERGRNGYRLGFVVFELGQRVYRQRALRDAALPFMQDLYEATHEIVYLGVLDRDEVVFVEKIAGHRAAFADGPPGVRVSAYASGIGKAILAFARPEVVESVLDAGLVRRAQRTITTPSLLLQQLVEVRNAGVAYEFEETRAGVCCVGSPILGRDGTAVAGLAVTGPTFRLQPEGVARAVKIAANGISRALRDQRTPAVSR